MFKKDQDISLLLSQVTTLDGIQALIKSGGDVFLVGGIVRDFFLGKESKDIDLLVRFLTIEEIVDILQPFGEVMEVGKSFGILKFVPFGWTQEPIDIAIPRTEKKIGTGHHGFEVTSDPFLSVEKDLQRRDFCLNSIAIKLDGSIVDPFGGMSDLENGVIRATSVESFIEDPLRILRCIGFASRFGFEIEIETLDLIRQHKSSIREISGERIITEFDKIIFKGDKIKGIELLHKTGIFVELFGSQDKIDIPMSILKDICTRGDFFFVLLQHLESPDSFFIKILKGDTETAKIIKALSHMVKVKKTTNTVFALRLLLVDLFKICPQILDSMIIQSEVGLAEQVSDVKSGKMIVSVSQLAVTGDMLKEVGFKEGKEIGIKLKELLLDVLEEKRDNTVESLLK